MPFICRKDHCIFLPFPDRAHFGYLSLSAACCSDVSVCHSHSCDVPNQQLPWAACHPIRLFVISAYKADWFFCCKDARPRHQSSNHQIVELLMSGNPARRLFVDKKKATLAASIEHHSTAANVRVPRLRPRRSSTAMPIASASNHTMLWGAPATNPRYQVPDIVVGGLIFYQRLFLFLFAL